MSFAGVFDAIAARYGQVVTVAKDGDPGVRPGGATADAGPKAPSSSPRT